MSPNVDPSLRYSDNEPPALLNPMPWWLVHAGLQTVAHILLKADVPKWLRIKAAETTTAIDDVILEGIAVTIERLAGGWRTPNEEK